MTDLICQDCDHANPTWFAPSPLWNLVMGGPEAKDDPGGVVCPCCFILRAERSGQRPTGWMLTPESPLPEGRPPTREEQIAQGALCSCRGGDYYCACQNVFPWPPSP